MAARFRGARIVRRLLLTLTATTFLGVVFDSNARAASIDGGFGTHTFIDSVAIDFPPVVACETSRRVPARLLRPRQPGPPAAGAARRPAGGGSRLRGRRPRRAVQAPQPARPLRRHRVPRRS